MYIFRMDANIARMKQSSHLLSLPEVDCPMLEKMIIDIVRQYADETPLPPGFYVFRPTHIGTQKLRLVKRPFLTKLAVYMYYYHP